MAVKPVLLIGGHGVAGRKTALQLRRRHPDLPLAIAGRDLVAAQAWAEELGNAMAYRADLRGDAPDLGLPHGEFSALATFLMDETGSALDFARRHAIGSVTVTGGAFELGQQAVLAMQAASTIPVVLGGNWFCGTALMPVLDLCTRLARIDEVEVGIVIDRNGSKSGPATTADFERILGSCATMPQRSDGRYQWVSAQAGLRHYTGTGGRRLEGKPSVSIDAVSIAAITGAKDVAVLETWGDSLSSLAGGPASDEIVIEACGIDRAGHRVRLRREIVASRQHAPLTAIGVALLLEQAGGLGGATLPPGLYFPEQALSPAAACAAMAQAGVEFSEIATTEYDR